eukprot:13650684-Alexandrium_andersonii.AAC.1
MEDVHLPAKHVGRHDCAVVRCQSRRSQPHAVRVLGAEASARKMAVRDIVRGEGAARVVVRVARRR